MIDHLTNLLSEAASRYPGCWERIDSLRLARNQSSNTWPAYCFFPVALAVDIVTDGKTLSDKDALHRGPDIAKLAALSTWRATQRIYEFDSLLLNQLRKTPASEAPFEIFRQLPDWCVYIQIPDESVKGCFVHMETSHRDHEELRLLFDFAKSGFDSLYPMVIHRFEGTVKDCLEIEMEESDRQLEPVDTEDIELNEFFKQNSIHLSKELKLLPQVISQALYLCSLNADYARPAVEKKSGKPGKSNVPDKAEEIEVGQKVGTKLKDLMSPGANGSIAHAHGRPQWHHYLTGPKEKKELILEWQPPLLDNSEKSVHATTRKS